MAPTIGQRGHSNNCKYCMVILITNMIHVILKNHHQQQKHTNQYRLLKICRRLNGSNYSVYFANSYMLILSVIQTSNTSKNKHKKHNLLTTEFFWGMVPFLHGQQHPLVDRMSTYSWLLLHPFQIPGLKNQMKKIKSVV